MGSEMCIRDRFCRLVETMYCANKSSLRRLIEWPKAVLYCNLQYKALIFYFDKKSFYGQFGQGSTFPQVVLDQTNLGGCTETVQYLREKKLV